MRGAGRNRERHGRRNGGCKRDRHDREKHGSMSRKREKEEKSVREEETGRHLPRRLMVKSHSNRRSRWCVRVRVVCVCVCVCVNGKRNFAHGPAVRMTATTACEEMSDIYVLEL